MKDCRHFISAVSIALLALTACESPEGDRKPADPSDSDQMTVPQPLIDAVGNQWIGPKPPQKVISSAPNLTEIVYLLGAGDRLVGRGEFDDFPQEAEEVEVVADLTSMNVERILQLNPDLILMTLAGNSRREYDRLKRLDLPVFALAADSLQGVISTIDTVGLLLGIPQRANAVTDSLQRLVDSIRLAASGPDRPSAFFIIEPSPLYTVSRGYIDEMIKIAGAENIASGEPIAYPQYSRERVLEQNPDLIFYAGHEPNITRRLLELYPEWAQLDAIREGHIYTVDPDILLRPGPRVVSGLSSLAAAVSRVRDDFRQ